MRQSGWLLLVIAAVPAGYASASAAPTSSGLQACTVENDDARRLACYDRELNRQPTKAAAATAAAAPVTTPAAAALHAPTPARAAEDDFGVRGSDVARQRDEQQKKDDPRATRLSSKVMAIDRQPRGELVMTLENGQTWQQKKPESYFPVKVGDQVSIASGALGSYRLSAPSGRSTQVTRTR